MEIERKFLVKNEEWRKHVSKKISIKQGYICNTHDCVIRIRITDETAYITVKGRGTSISRPEYEYEIPSKDAEEMFQLFCQNANLEKTRNIVIYEGHKWEIDEYGGRHKGLITAEVELKTENEEIIIPSFIGKEVTGEAKYYNSNLVKNE